MRMLNSLFYSLAVLAGAGYSLEAQTAGRTSENTPQLRRILDRAPDADTDGDGILTEAEGRTYVDALRRRLNSHGVTSPTHADIAYGDHARHRLDIWLPQSEAPTPVVIFIHGGGFLAGDKRQLRPHLIDPFLAAKIAVVSINYRYSSIEPYPGPMQDGARAVQFIRSQADAWNLDSERVAAFGGSAGAAISLWLAFHDDLADPESDDPVARQSSRLVCAGALGGQSSLDFIQINEWMGGNLREEQALLRLYGADSYAQLSEPEYRSRMKDASPISHLTKDDPPVFLGYTVRNDPVTDATKRGDVIHHPIFGIRLKAAMDALAIECALQYPGRDKGKYPRGIAEFLIFQLTAPATETTSEHGATDDTPE